MHLLNLRHAVEQLQPQAAIIDSTSSYLHMGDPAEVLSLMMRLLDFLKTRQVTLFMTSLTDGGAPAVTTGTDISSLVDTWLVLRNQETVGFCKRSLHILKARGIAHDNDSREVVLTDRGVELRQPASRTQGS